MSFKGFKYTVVDVFTLDHRTKFGGNQLAIIEVPPDRRAQLTQEEKQAIAREFNFSESVFLHPPVSASTEEAAREEWTIDIFLPWEEIPLAGHPTIGSAWFVKAVALKEKQGKEVALRTKAGLIPLEYKEQDGGLLSTAQIPHDVHIHRARKGKDELLKFQPGLHGSSIGTAEMSIPCVSPVKGLSFALVELDSVETLGLLGLTPFPATTLVEVDEETGKTFAAVYFFVVDREKSRNGFLKLDCRMIEGTLEDAATGSAAVTLAASLALGEFPEWALQGDILEVEISQGKHLGRPSAIKVKVVMNQSGGIDKIFLSGFSIQTMSGTLS